MNGPAFIWHESRLCLSDLAYVWSALNLSWLTCIEHRCILYCRPLPVQYIHRLQSGSVLAQIRPSSGVNLAQMDTTVLPTIFGIHCKSLQQKHSLSAPEASLCLYKQQSQTACNVQKHHICYVLTQLPKPVPNSSKETRKFTVARDKKGNILR